MQSNLCQLLAHRSSTQQIAATRANAPQGAMIAVTFPLSRCPVNPLILLTMLFNPQSPSSPRNAPGAAPHNDSRNHPRNDAHPGLPSSLPLLISVRSLAEARHMAGLPIAILDFKNPHDGALGRCSEQTLTQARHLPSPALGLSAAWGELHPWIAQGATRVPSGFQFVKAGPQGIAQPAALADAMRRFADALPSDTQAVAVAYADHRRADTIGVDAIAELSIQLRHRWLLIDTFSKDGRDLLQWMSPQQLTELVAHCHDHHLRVVLAGSISLAQSDTLLATGADLLGVRGAICTGTRQSSVDPGKVLQWCEHLAGLQRQNQEDTFSASLRNRSANSDLAAKKGCL